jgi:hypothetical protein
MNTNRRGSGRRPAGLEIALVAACGFGMAGLSACGDDPFAINWTPSPDTVLLYSLARPELNLVSGFNFRRRQVVRIEGAESTGAWDMAVDTREGQIVLLPPGALGVESAARIAPMPGETFESLLEAPSDTLLYTASDAVPATVGTAYVVRTERYAGAFGTRCVSYAKFEPLDVDPAAGTLTFVFDVSPVCNDRRLIPPD